MDWTVDSINVNSKKYELSLDIFFPVCFFSLSCSFSLSNGQIWFHLNNYWTGFFILGQVTRWFVQIFKHHFSCSSEAEQNDFLRRLIVKFDERQQYFTSCVITVRSHSWSRSFFFLSSNDSHHFSNDIIETLSAFYRQKSLFKFSIICHWKNWA